MNNKQIVKELSSKLNQPQIEVAKLVTSCTQVILNIIDEDKGITIPNLGTFKTYMKNKRKSFDPFNKIMIMLPPKRLIKFSPSSILKDELKNKKI